VLVVEAASFNDWRTSLVNLSFPAFNGASAFAADDVLAPK